MKIFIRTEFGRVWLDISGLPENPNDPGKNALRGMQGFFREYYDSVLTFRWNLEEAKVMMGDLFHSAPRNSREEDFSVPEDLKGNLIRLYNTKNPLEVPIGRVPFLAPLL